MGPAQLHETDVAAFSASPKVRRVRSAYRLVTWTTPHRLSPSCRDRVYGLLTDVAGRAFGTDHAPYWKARKENRFFDQIAALSLILAPDGEIVGWGCYQRHRFAGRRVVYLDVAGVLPEYRRDRLAARLQQSFLTYEILLRNPLRPTYLVLRTQNPAIHAGFTKHFGPQRVFPQPGRPVPPKIQQIGEEAAAHLGHADSFDPRTLVIDDALRSLADRLYAEPPASTDERLDAFFRERIGPGGAFLLVMRVGPLPLVACLVRQAARRMPARLRPHG